LRPYGIAISPNGDRVWASALNSSQVSVIDTANDAVLASFNLGVNPPALAFNPSGTRVFVTSGGDQQVYVLDSATYQVLASIGTPTPRAIAVIR
jgi:YVTN family beta-propeller protein